MTTPSAVDAPNTDATEQGGGLGDAIRDATDQANVGHRLTAYASKQPDVARRSASPADTEHVDSAIESATDQGSRAEATSLDATDQTASAQGVAPDAAEQVGAINDAIPDPTEKRSRPFDDEEAKSETDEPPNQCKDFIDLDVFDSDDFMEGLRKDRLFGPTAEDDVNFVATADLSDCESDADDEDVMADNAVAPEGVEDVEDVEMNEGDLDTGTFDLTDEDLRSIAESGWVTYDEEHSVWPRSAIAYADSPLGMFFYFLPKELWVRIAEETERYRLQSIPAMAISRREKLLARQAKDPRVSVPNLEDIEADLSKFKPTQAHEIVHVVALLFARAVAPIRDGLAHHWSTDEDGAIPRAEPSHAS
ncbi:hypothetical protein PF007_g24925 [Phytophthora fragariae]|uniref:PiggyBac transposable element-derived protein domain-containing protein n=1 Tax=Phytophthora fragariae TaxID=53985 RepID=A0A6A3QI24_9STRA|nr:hypothetical protein PF009_g26250 [Phytophthora fragariae]KAE9075628.1 hypothetical protein PF007_g24925 [Phytophthora fragariae]